MSEFSGNFQNRLDLADLNQTAEQIKIEIGKVIVGQSRMIELLLVALLSDGHVLMEGIPGIAKTLTAKLLSRCISVRYSRIQFTPDLMPSDVIGTNIYNLSKSSFEFSEGPIFSNIVLIDEINRSPAKTQSALFEVMEERQITTDGVSRTMDRPFMVIATQNPIEHEGTYRLPEAQLDRFLFRIQMDYPALEEEEEILLRSHHRGSQKEIDAVKPVLSSIQLQSYQEIVRKVYMEPNLLRFIAQISHKSRNHNSLFLGASPRASILVLNASKAYAALQGRDFVIPDDIRDMLVPILNHRLILAPEKEMEGFTAADIIRQIIQTVEIPK